jgi:hypothetical protein
MVLTANQIQTFFTANDQIGLPLNSFQALANEGINSVNGLKEFDKDDIVQVAKNLRSANLVFGAKSQKRLIVACQLVRYYDAVGRTITANNIMWDPIMENFETQWKALIDAKGEGNEPETPKITKSLGVVEWSEAFIDYLHRCIGVRMIPLAYVVREVEDPPAAAPPLAANSPHSEEHKSIENELIARAKHEHPLFRNDNKKVYNMLEVATRGTQYSATLKGFQRNKDGRGAYLSILSQHVGLDKLQLAVTKHESFLTSQKWKSTSNLSLESFCAKHRTAFEGIKAACEKGVPYQLPTEYTRVTHLLNAIETSDAGLQAAMANVKADNDPIDGKRHNFEATVAFITPFDPVAIRPKRSAAAISAAETDVTVSSMKTGIGKTGVHLRFHSHSEYKTLTAAQKAELKEWRETTPEGRASVQGGKKKSQSRKKSKKGDKATINAIVQSLLATKEKGEKQTKDTDEFNTAVSSAVVRFMEDNLVKDDEPKLQPAKNPTTLQSILRKIRNPK